jgi:hypothetical protein
LRLFVCEGDHSLTGFLCRVSFCVGSVWDGEAVFGDLNVPPGLDSVSRIPARDVPQHYAYPESSRARGQTTRGSTATRSWLHDLESKRRIEPLSRWSPHIGGLRRSTTRKNTRIVAEYLREENRSDRGRARRSGRGRSWAHAPAAATRAGKAWLAGWFMKRALATIVPDDSTPL